MKPSPAKHLRALMQFLARGLLAVACLLAASANGLDYAGASAVLRQVAEGRSKPAAPKTERDDDPTLRAELEAFAQSAAELPPADAARRWLGFVDRGAAKLQRARQNASRDRAFPSSDGQDVMARDLFNALPPPAAWGELAKAIAARPAAAGQGEALEIGLRLLAATLNNDEPARQRVVAEMQSKARDGGSSAGSSCLNALLQLRERVLANSDDPEVVMKSLEDQLNAAPEWGMLGFRVPNLVVQIGAEKARSYLRKALTRKNVELEFDSHNETFRLTQKLALQLVGQLGGPHWGLAESLDAVELYEAMEKRFPAENPGLDPNTNLPLGGADVYERIKAKPFYLLGLVAQGRSKDAIAIARRPGGTTGVEFPYEAINDLEITGHASALDDFFYALLSHEPGLPFWQNYRSIAERAGRTGRMCALARTAVAREDLGDSEKAEIHRVLCQALLASDEVEEAVQELRRLIAPGSSAPRLFQPGWSAGECRIRLANLGVLLKRPEWTSEGVEATKQWLDQTGDLGRSYLETAAVLDALAEILFNLGRGSEMEAIFTHALVASTRPTGNELLDAYNDAPLARNVLAGLAGLYHRAGRSADVLTLLEQSPDWGARDLSELFRCSAGGDQVSIFTLPWEPSGLPLPLVAAHALTAVGRKQPAGRIIDELLIHQPGLDRAYELLLALRGANALARLEELAAQDQFDERPLVWKAQLLKQQNRLAEAEAAARQAIAIDPSDGDEGIGERLRGYTELTDIRERRGDRKEAKACREKVQAMRFCEDADRFYDAGLLNRAIAIYKKGLKQFPDAWCIHVRLALQLSTLGKNREAEVHYRRACELMPDSLGRAKFHSSFCDRAFGGEFPRGIADKVLTRLAARHPGKPQVHYLLGRLRQEQERFAEARTSYLNAVRLDPNYLGAWRKLDELNDRIRPPARERDQVIFSLLRLDPRQRHHAFIPDRVSDLPALWQAADAAARRQPPPVSDLFKLAASDAAMAALGKEPAPLTSPEILTKRLESGRNSLPAGQALLETTSVSAASWLMLTDVTTRRMVQPNPGGPGFR